MSFSVSWHTLLDEADDLAADAVLVTPLSQTPFRISDTQEHRIIIDYVERDETRPLQCDQFETLFRRVGGEPDQEFDLERLPPDADPFAAVWSLHPRMEVDEDAGVIRQTDLETTTQVATTGEAHEETERTEPDLQVYSDALLLTDALERYDIETVGDVETETLVDLYTMLSDVQRSADDLRKQIADAILSRLHHDQPVSGQFGSVQRTTRRQRTLKDEETVLNALEAAGIDRDRVTSVDRDKVDDALEVTELAESDLYELDTTEYVRKADVDEETKETQLQGLKDRLAASDAEDDDVAQLQDEIAELEERIDELTSFNAGSSYHTSSASQ
jgi:ubiquinone biosynthesis protein UbiJ